MRVVPFRIDFKASRARSEARKPRNGHTAPVHAASAMTSQATQTQGQSSNGAPKVTDAVDSDAYASNSGPEASSSVQLLDLPPALIQEIFAHIDPGASRTGVVLPFVCKAFRSALSDGVHQRLWTHIQPDLCRARHGTQWPGFAAWLNARASAVCHLVLP
jgi:hypothetical protein